MSVFAKLTPNQQSFIVSNVVEACADISKLMPSSYQFLSACVGFSTFGSLHNFKFHFKSEDLGTKILANQSLTQWNTFEPGESYYDYMMARVVVYNKIVSKLIAKLATQEK